MRAPDYLLKKGVTALACIGDGRQSGTSGSPSILNASPEAATGGGLALLKTGDRVRIDLKKRTANMLVTDAELAKRRAAFEAAGGYKYPPARRRGRKSSARHRRRTVAGHGAEAGGEVPAHQQDLRVAAGQPLRLPPR
jgi:dihydroxyacid dehydratase/phosphogluconate dehydratase